MRKQSELTRGRDLSEKVVISLCLSLLVCMGFHHADLLKPAAAILSGPAGCAQPPAFVLGVQAQVASDEDLIPAPRAKTARTSTVSKTSTPEPVVK